jgi:hypothetical protein
MPKIYATGNERLNGVFNISYYIVEKDDNFLVWLGRLLVEVFEIKDGERRAKFIFKNIENEDGAIVETEIYAKEIKKMIDIHEQYGNRVDLFYGKERVYVTLRQSEEVRKRFVKFVAKTREWIVIKEIPTLPVYAGKKLKNKDINT